jgi:hypothetical protein
MEEREEICEKEKKYGRKRRNIIKNMIKIWHEYQHHSKQEIQQFDNFHFHMRNEEEFYFRKIKIRN